MHFANPKVEVRDAPRFSRLSRVPTRPHPRDKLKFNTIRGASRGPFDDIFFFFLRKMFNWLAFIILASAL